MKRKRRSMIVFMKIMITFLPTTFFVDFIAKSVTNYPSETPEDAANGKLKGKKRKADGSAANTSSHDTTVKRQKPEELKPKKTHPKHEPSKTVFVSNLSPMVTEEDLQKSFPNAVLINLVLDRKGNSKRYAYVQLPSEDDAKTALGRDREILKNRPMFISKCKESNEEEKQHAFKYATGVEPNKLFVRGLPIKYSKEDVEQLFKPYGCTDVRLITHKSGRPKGLAYVEFPSEEMAKEALKAKDQCQIGEHTISVAISAPPPKKDSKQPDREPVRHARSRLQVPLIPRILQTKPDTSLHSSGPSKSNDDFRKMLFRKENE